MQRESPHHMSGRKVGERTTKPPGFTMPRYFYIYNISSHDFGAIQTPRAEIYIFTTGTPYKISSRALLPPSLRTGIFTVKCACPEPFRARDNMLSRTVGGRSSVADAAVYYLREETPNMCLFQPWALRARLHLGTFC
jgi:hypothetical protein